MCFRSATRTIVATGLLGAMLGGCSEYYFDRRDTITLYYLHRVDPEVRARERQ